MICHIGNSYLLYLLSITLSSDPFLIFFLIIITVRSPFIKRYGPIWCVTLTNDQQASRKGLTATPLSDKCLFSRFCPGCTPETNKYIILSVKKNVSFCQVRINYLSFVFFPSTGVQISSFNQSSKRLLTPKLFFFPNPMCLCM